MREVTMSTAFGPHVSNPDYRPVVHSVDRVHCPLCLAVFAAMALVCIPAMLFISLLCGMLLREILEDAGLLYMSGGAILDLFCAIPFFLAACGGAVWGYHSALRT